MKCLIVDDEPLAVDLIESFVKKIPYLNLVGSCSNAFDAMEKMQDEDIDLLFLDIQMPNLTGIEWVKSMNKAPMIIFTTAYSNYAVDGFNLNAVDYLVKPIPFERFLKAVNKAYEYFRLHNQAKKDRPVNETANSLLGKFIMVKADYSLVKIDLDKIQYVEGLRDYLKIYIDDNNHKPILTLNSLKKIEDILPSDHFIRVHRSFIVSIGKIEAIQKHRIIIGKERIPIGEIYKNDFYDLMDKNNL